MVDLSNANAYLTHRVLHNEDWMSADDITRQRALNTAEIQLYRLFRRFQPDIYPIPEEAVFEQALWLLRMDETIRKTQQGVKSVSVSGLSISMDRVNPVSPEVIAILGRRVGRYAG
ncbi:hypothetical protein H1S01_17665 [Heliobacterium chlorum]|uniref:Uncharacterized protein n=1 Tax=Heliobacterium chlorum TaxID=2698 RepID=A0ABR7T690_HELCL|nr:hypothetical protein [Heliobacterium chlorum]MBC9786289.1 hypothetical protein [Heliobacterium chlorum]